MIELIALADGRKELRQWDTKRQIKIDGDYTQIHFSNVTFGRSEDVEAVNGVADIPDKLLQFDGKLYIYGYVGTYESGYTAYEQVFDIVKRPKPAGYVFTPTEQKTLAEIEKKIGDLANLETEAKANLVAAINEANKNGGGGGGSGEDGATFYPSVDADGNLSWTNDKGLPNPATVNIKGADGANGYAPVRGTDYWTDADKAEIIQETSNSVVEEKGIRKTIFVNQYGVCFNPLDYSEYSIGDFVNDVIAEPLKYKFVYYESSPDDFGNERVPFSIDLNLSVGGIQDILLLVGEDEISGYVYYGIYEIENNDGNINFTVYKKVATKSEYGNVMIGDFLSVNEGVVGVDKKALLGDVEASLDVIISIQNALIGGEGA